MRDILAKIILCIASGLLFSHQVISHHHHEDAIVSRHHDHDEDTDTHHHLPAHYIAHNFSLDNAVPDLVKIPVKEIYFTPNADSIISKLPGVTRKSPFYTDTGPPKTKYYKDFPLRSPPVCC